MEYDVYDAVIEMIDYEETFLQWRNFIYHIRKDFISSLWTVSSFPSVNNTVSLKRSLIKDAWLMLILEWHFRADRFVRNERPQNSTAVRCICIDTGAADPTDQNDPLISADYRSVVDFAIAPPHRTRLQSTGSRFIGRTSVSSVLMCS